MSDFGERTSAKSAEGARVSCGDCDRPDSEFIDFLVATPIWNYVMGGQETTTYTIREGLFDKTHYPRVEGVGGVVCLACFDQRARALNIPYRETLVVFGADCWMGYSKTAEQMPLVSTYEERDWDEQPANEVSADVGRSLPESANQKDGRRG